jgi:RNA-directed DNA polymerase
MRVQQSIVGQVTSPENLFLAWDAFRSGKSRKTDVQQFEMRLEENLLQLHHDLASGTYRHGSYSAFTICDPKERRIHKATVRDRVVHHAVFAALNPFYEWRFIAHSFSCRTGKGTHRAVDALDRMLRSVSGNGTKRCFALKCDVRRFFASVDHTILRSLLRRHVPDDYVLALADEIIGSFPCNVPFAERRVGVPIGNLTSQLFANVYMNVFDQFVKHELRLPHYVRYTDDFVVVSVDEDYLHRLVPVFQAFLRERLHLELHPRKVTIRKYLQGIDFLGYVLRPHHRVIRTKTKRRIRRILRARVEDVREGTRGEESLERSLESYRGVLSHADAFGLRQDIEQTVWEQLVA